MYLIFGMRTALGKAVKFKTRRTIMGIFTRFRDIVTSNINAMLDKAEDPEKLIKLMIQEMEDTLVEIKASCAGAMAGRKKVVRALDDASLRVSDWSAKAKLAVSKGREDLAREALMERRRYTEEIEHMENECQQFADIVDQYQEDIRQLEEKLATARQKHNVLVQRHRKAQQKKRTHSQIRYSESNDTVIRFEHFENRIERMEADADLVNFARKPVLDDEFAKLVGDEEIESELSALKNELSEQTSSVEKE